MREFLAGWIIFQLIIISIVYWEVVYKIKNNTYICNEVTYDYVDYVIISITFPLLIFVNDWEINKYCENK